MQTFGTIVPIIVKGPNFVQMRLISYRSIIKFGGIVKFLYFWQNFTMDISHKSF